MPVKEIPSPVAIVINAGNELEIPTEGLAKAYEEAGKILAAAQNMSITANEHLKPAVEDLGVIAAGKKVILEIKKAITTPLKARLDAINNGFNFVLKPIEDADKILRDKISAFKAEQDAKAAEAAAINQQKEALARREAALNDGIITVDTTPVTAPPAAPEHTYTDIASQGFMKTHKWEIIDLSLVPREYLIIDAGKVTKMARASKGEIKIPGIRIFTEEAVRINTKKDEA
jgi:azurin